MDLTQILTIFASVSIPVIVGFSAFYTMTQREISVIREQTAKLDQNHREDIKAMDARWWEHAQRSDERWVSLVKIQHEGKRQA